MNLLKTFCGLLLLAALTAGCSPAPQQTNAEPGVQDITPGEQSVIQPPAQRTQQTTIQERKL